MILKTARLRRRSPVQRPLEVATGLASLLLVSAPVWSAVLAPGLLGAVLLLFSGYWFLRTLSVAIGAALTSRRLQWAMRADWRAAGERLPGWAGLHHLVIVPTYGEPVAVLSVTLHHLAAQDFPRDRVHVVLAFEARDRQAPRRRRELQERFRGAFAHLWATFHEDRPGEVRGKSSNLAHAARWAYAQLVERLGIPAESVLVTVCDADARLHPRYLSALSVTALDDPDRHFHLYQPAIFFYANLWRLPVLARVANAIYSMIELSKLALPARLIIQSTYSVPLATVAAVGFWDVDVVPEDSRLFFKTFFTLGERVRVVPVHLPVWCDAAEGATPWQTLLSQYHQARRWAWGVSDVPYVLLEAWRQRQIPFWLRWRRVASFVADHFLWAAHWFLIVLGMNLAPLLAPAYFQSPAGRALFELSGVLLALCTPCLLGLALTDLQLRPPHPTRPDWSARLGELLALLLLPVTGLLLTSLPAVDAHLRLLLGRRLSYQVTRKLPGGWALEDEAGVWSGEPTSAQV